MEHVIDINKHRQLEIAIVRKLEKEGFKVNATHIGHPDGPPIKSFLHPARYGFKPYKPDILACKGSEKYFIEIVTRKRINKQAINKLLALSSMKGYKLGIIAPKSSIDSIKNIAKDNNIQYSKLWSLDI
ncbi:MAG: hypothetical protein O8C63_02380 [Candidatus Methanoperedens sp.]|nr:hypothetical protein [Candidatus Methanoperedens sp.]